MNHYEKRDGSCFGIPESARIVALADVFDTLAMLRPYKEPWVLEAIFATIREGSGKHFDPRVVSCFFDIQAEILEIKDAWAPLYGDI
ncbi:HD-GYP domain-containing protein [Methylobacter sp. S3L5C]|uniref:HD-GYP domain-containing protein n=1 Tax=Methylobacter sp. S3L5C TaxID=2839024 RepID=UPI001FAB9374|nr:HD domain-containing phosphohydrolase [Methylobacter sp. S3L5C]UOA09669.1 hypothetical protein KKZ03_05105 [Methylobacter sp. S3L5C]